MSAPLAPSKPEMSYQGGYIHVKSNDTARISRSNDEIMDGSKDGIKDWFKDVSKDRSCLDFSSFISW